MLGCARLRGAHARALMFGVGACVRACVGGGAAAAPVLGRGVVAVNAIRPQQLGQFHQGRQLWHLPALCALVWWAACVRAPLHHRLVPAK